VVVLAHRLAGVRADADADCVSSARTLPIHSANTTIEIVWALLVSRIFFIIKAPVPYWLVETNRAPRRIQGSAHTWQKNRIDGDPDYFAPPLPMLFISL
jgi:hypothetical protein